MVPMRLRGESDMKPWRLRRKKCVLAALLPIRDGASMKTGPTASEPRALDETPLAPIVGLSGM